jgi:RNA polymerase sigma factor (TIGR02999 family)
MEANGQVTRLLAAARSGDPTAIEAIFPIVYGELRGIASRQLRGANATLNTTAVVHEAYLKLVGASSLQLQDRHHFFALAATAMRQVLLDHARRHLSEKRGGGAAHTLLDDNSVAVESRAVEIVELDLALQKLSQLDARLGQVVELRFFAGLSVEETAEVMEISAITVKREWRRAKAFLFRELNEGEQPT